MSDDQDKESKTEEASEKKIRDAVEKGQTPFSKETPIFFSLLAILFVTSFLMANRVSGTAHQLGAMLDQAQSYSLEGNGDLYWIIKRVMVITAAVTVPLLAALVVAAITGSVVQNPPRPAPDRIKPKLSRISLKKGWERIFSMKGFVEFLKSIGKLIVAAILVAVVLNDMVPRMMEGIYTESSSFLEVILGMVIKMISAIIAAMVVIATADFFWSRYKWKEDLKMTKQEVKDEVKQAQGDPIVKARMRSVAQDRSRRRMMADVPKASLVIANPTHLAIALRYDPTRDEAPVVVAKGADLIALRIREIAEEHGVPVFQNVELARAMYKNVTLEQVIPHEFFKAVAELISIIRRRAQHG